MFLSKDELEQITMNRIADVRENGKKRVYRINKRVYAIYSGEQPVKHDKGMQIASFIDKRIDSFDSNNK